MKILLIGPVPPHIGSNNPGGIAHHLWSLATELDGLGHEVSIIAVGRYIQKSKYEDGIQIYGIDKKLLPFLRALSKIPKILFKIGLRPSLKTYFHVFYSLFRVSAVKDLGRFDVIHLHGLHNSALYALEVLDIDVPKIVTVHSYHHLLSLSEDKVESTIAFINKYLNLAEGLVHVSHADRKKGRDLGLSFKGADRVIHNGLQTGILNKISKGKGICFVGLLISRKRIALLLEAIEFLASDFKELNVIGDGTQKRKVELAADNNRLINYHGVLPNDEVREIMRTSSVLVVPSLSESFGIVYIEALFEGTAVIGYAPTIEEFQNVMDLSELERKLVVPVPAEEIQPEKLAKIIDSTYEFRQSPEGIQAMERVRQKAIEAFGWDAVIDKMTTLYEDITDSKLNSRA